MFLHITKKYRDHCHTIRRSYAWPMNWLKRNFIVHQRQKYLTVATCNKFWLLCYWVDSVLFSLAANNWHFRNKGIILAKTCLASHSRSTKTENIHVQHVVAVGSACAWHIDRSGPQAFIWTSRSAIFQTCNKTSKLCFCCWFAVPYDHLLVQRG